MSRCMQSDMKCRWTVKAWEVWKGHVNDRSVHRTVMLDRVYCGRSCDSMALIGRL